MSNRNIQVFHWKEFVKTRHTPSPEIDTLGNALYQNFRTYVAVAFPTPITNGMWEFKPLGWVGTIPVTESFLIWIQPKAPLANLFKMWEYAYRLKNFRFFDDIVGCQSLTDFYQNLADILAKKILVRVQKGLYRAYIDRVERLPYVSGRLDIRRMASEPWRVDIDCTFEEHTADVDENRILCWVLSVIARSGLCEDPAVLSRVRRAYRELLGCTTLTPILPKACVGRLYDRLNDDYKPLHSLCRFFLEHRGPTHQLGDYATMPFLMDMARLFELFVAEWLRQNLPPEFELKEQHTVNDEGGELQFRIDVVILDRVTGTPKYVLDTKYKIAETPNTEDIHEVRSYADALGCSEAALIYPIELQKPRDSKMGNIRVRTLTFAVDGDIDKGGKAFLNSLLRLNSNDRENGRLVEK